MRKIFAIILVFLTLISSGIVAFSQENEYDCIIYPRAEVFYFNPEEGQRIFGININTLELKGYEYVQYNILFNNEIVKYDNIVFTALGVYSRDCTETDTGVTYKVSIPKESSHGTPDGDSVTLQCQIKGTGDINFSVTAFAVLPDGSRKELNIYTAPFCDKIVDVSEIEFINKENLNMYNTITMVSNGISVKEFTDLSKNKTAVIKTKDNVLLDDSAVIPNGAYIATIYEHFVVDRVDICVMNDVNCDGEVTAADARLALRHSAKLEYLQSLAYSAADVDGKSGITAADARLILRKAAQID